jgi:hypothetical protein
MEPFHRLWSPSGQSIATSGRPPSMKTLPRLNGIVVSLVMAAVSLSGCATITRGVHEALVVESEPSGATVTLSTGDTGTTPTSFRIRRRGALDVTIEKKGYEIVHVHVSTQIAGWGAAGMAGNVLVGGIIGVGVDAFSGGTLEHKPNPIKVNLVQVDQSQAVLPPPVPPTAAPQLPTSGPTPAPATTLPQTETSQPSTPKISPDPK